MRTLNVLLGLMLMLFSGAAPALIDTIFVQVRFGLSYLPGNGDFLTLDGAPWSVDSQVTFVTEGQGTYLKVTFAEASAGGTPVGIAAFPANLAPIPAFADHLAFIPIYGPPHFAGQVETRLIETIPEPSTIAFLAAAIALLPWMIRRRHFNP